MTDLAAENRELARRLQEAEDTLRAIGAGEVDAFVIAGPEGDKVYTLKGAEQPYRSLVETMSEGAAHLSADGTILFCNSRLAGMLGLPLEHLIGTSFVLRVSPQDRARVADMLGSAGRGGLESEEICLVRDGGESLHALISCSIAELPGGEGRGIVLTDIGRIKKAEAELEQEKTLLVELLHRVKNTLAQINALASIEASLSKSPEVKEALGGLVGRIETMSNLYAMLNSGGQPGKVRLDLYLADVALALVAALDKDRKRVNPRFDLEEITVEAKEASAFGLMLNELLTNAYKYAFPGDRRGEILLSLKEGAGELCMELSNDGVELPEGFDPSRSKGLGLMLVGDLSRQLGGELRWERGKWTIFRVCAPRVKRPQ